jgi:GDPmannose 4,6-dehydratase
MLNRRHRSAGEPIAVVTGAAGQDGGFLVQRLVREGFRVHAVVRTASTFPWNMVEGFEALVELHELDFNEPEPVAALIARLSPTELYNLAGVSSVSQSFREPELTWMTNATVVGHILEALRTRTPSTRMYQASSSEMFGWIPGGSVVHGEDAPFLPQSPYAAAKAAAHLLCTTYRRAYGLRVACGILFNHESRRRSSTFLTRKVTDHVRRLMTSSEPIAASPLALGNLKIRRDWGFAPDYVDGMCRILRQVEVRARVAGLPAEEDEGTSYRDYVIGTGQTHAVWELVGRAFELGGFQLTWELGGEDPLHWGARFTTSLAPAVVVDATFLRPSDPLVIQADAERARRELGWAPEPGLDPFLSDMLRGDAPAELH